jgi:hypothetical protein
MVVGGTTPVGPGWTAAVEYVCRALARPRNRRMRSDVRAVPRATIKAAGRHGGRAMRANRSWITLGSVLLLSLLAIVGCASGGGTILSTVGSGVDNREAGGGQAPPAASAAPLPADEVGNLVDEAKIVRTGTIELQVTDVAIALQTARDGIRALGGYIGVSETANIDDQPVATITYRVPVDRWEDALDLLRSLAGQTTKVLNERTNAVEVTGAVVDLEARIRNLRASEIALQEISSKATRVSDVLEVQAQLTAVRGQIEQLTAQLTQLENQASYATLTATFGSPVVAVQVAAERWEPAVVVDEATASLVDILQALTTAGIWFAIVWLPLLLVIGVIGFLVVTVLRRLGLIAARRRGGDAPATG